MKTMFVRLRLFQQNNNLMSLQQSKCCSSSNKNKWEKKLQVAKVSSMKKKKHFMNCLFTGKLISFFRNNFRYSSFFQVFGYSSLFSRFSRYLLHIPGFSRFFQDFPGAGHPVLATLNLFRGFDIKKTIVKKTWKLPILPTFLYFTLQICSKTTLKVQKCKYLMSI